MLGICRARVRQIPRGFTLIEIAVAIFIITLLLGSILVPLTTQVESRNYDTTQRILDQARDSLLGYAAAYGYFPCPAFATSSEAVTSHATGACAAAVTGTNIYYGFLPAATLGFTPVDTSGYAIDAWGLSPFNRIRYAVSSVTVNGITLPFTRTNGMKNAGMSSIAGAATLLYVCNSGTGVVAGTNCGTAVALTSNAIVVIWSVGPNAPTGGSSVHEAQNPNPNSGSTDRLFVSRTKAAAGAAGGEFDDIVTWIGSPTLFNRLIVSGQLP
jgi:prepilin-type N-terminal cleavage/methylation domain-containing protein